MDLQQLRAQIDSIDSQIIELALKRLNIMSDVVEYKKQKGLNIFDPKRESEVLERIYSRCGGGFFGGGMKLLYGILIDLNKLFQYESAPKKLNVPTDAGGASIRAVLPDRPGELSRYIAPLAAAGINISSIRAQSMPGGKIAVDIELHGKTDTVEFNAALDVLADCAEGFVIL